MVITIKGKELWEVEVAWEKRGQEKRSRVFEPKEKCKQVSALPTALMFVIGLVRGSMANNEGVQIDCDRFEQKLGEAMQEGLAFGTGLHPSDFNI